MTVAESQNTEYKQGWRDEYLKWICGFANAHDLQDSNLSTKQPLSNQQDSGQVSPSEEKSFVSANDTKQLSERQHLVIRMIQKNDTITINAIAHETKASEITIKCDLAYLQEKGFLIREGGRKNGRWVVVNPQKKPTD